MDKLSNHYPNHLIFNHNYTDKEKIIYFESLISQAYNYNPNFKKMDKFDVKKNADNILSEMKKKYFQSSSEEIISIISTMRMWTRNDLPSSFKIDNEYNYKLHMQRLKNLKSIK